jgi:hypothetical protein
MSSSASRTGQPPAVAAPARAAPAHDPRPRGTTWRYVEALPKSQHNPEWRTAIHFLLMAAEGSLPVIFANITLLKALNAGQPKPTSEPRKKAANKYSIVR